MPELLKGIDLSFSTLTEAILDKLWADGVRVIGQDLWTARAPVASAQANLRLAQRKGFITLGYICINGAHDGAYHVAKGRAVVDQATWDRLALTPIDVEVVPITPQHVRQAVEAAAALGKRRCLYTRRLLWQEELGNDASFGDCLLWDAHYNAAGQSPNPSLDDFTPYGAWTRAHLLGKQYMNTHTYSAGADSVDIDANTFVGELLQQQQDEEDDDMPVPWIRAKGAGGAGLPYRTYIVSGGKKLLVASADQEKAFLDSGYIAGQPKDLALQELKAIPSAAGTPEPDE